MVDTKELLILSQFRKNARENLTTTSRRIHIPISTIYDRLKKYEGTIIRRHTSLLDFTKLGFAIKIHIVLKVGLKDKGTVRKFLSFHPRTNSLFGISNGYDFMAEIILRDFEEVESFMSQLEKFDILDHHEFYIVSDLKREEFLLDSQMIEMA